MMCPSSPTSEICESTKSSTWWSPVLVQSAQPCEKTSTSPGRLNSGSAWCNSFQHPLVSDGTGASNITKGSKRISRKVKTFIKRMHRRSTWTTSRLNSRAKLMPKLWPNLHLRKISQPCSKRMFSKSWSEPVKWPILHKLSFSKEIWTGQILVSRRNSKKDNLELRQATLRSSLRLRRVTLVDHVSKLWQRDSYKLSKPYSQT